MRSRLGAAFALSRSVASLHKKSCYYGGLGWGEDWLASMKQRASIEARVKSLRKEILLHNKKYYGDDRPDISDYEYDLLLRELEALEAEHPGLRLPGSPTETIGAEPKSAFGTVRHPYPMLSLENAMNEQEVVGFVARRERDLGRELKAYSLSLKYDGLAVELTYRNGLFVLGSTRGNGTEGEDVTPNLKTIKNIPKRLVFGAGEEVGTLVVRGEVVMSKQGFERLNKEQASKGLEPYAQARSAASGSVRQLDAKTTASRALFCYVYQVAGVADLTKSNPKLRLSTQTEQVDWLRGLGFEPTSHHYFCENVAGIKKTYRKLLKERNNLPYETDGVVVKVDSQEAQDVLGSAGRKPRYAIAWKFPPTIVQTQLERITFQVGRTGVVTPVAELKPVRIRGAEIRRATLHNEREIQNKGLLLGDFVEVIRSGDVIPKVLRPIVEKRTGKELPIEFPTNCPRCGEKLVRDAVGQGILIRCENPNCPATFETKVMHFVSKEAMNIEGLGKELVRQLIDKKHITSLDDIFALEEKHFDDLDRMGDVLRDKLLRAIERSKKIPLNRFVYALGVRNVGLVTATTLANKYGSIQSILRSMQKEDLYDINNVGEALSQSLVSFFRDPNVQAMIHSMLSRGVEPLAPAPEAADNKPFSGKRLLFTGRLGISRNIAKQQAEEVGFEVASSISKSLDVLVVGEDPGSKLRKAEELGIRVMTEEEFFSVLKDAGQG